MITHYDLFAGIGGFSLALEEVFDDPVRHIFCEWESFPTSVLRRHWPDGEFYGDIADLVAHTHPDNKGLEGSQRPSVQGRGVGRSLDGDDATDTRSAGLEETRTGKPTERRGRGGDGHDFTLVTGGFPCQPFSAAGRRRGTADDRYQWPNMFEVIRNVKPEWVIAENVRGLITWNEGMVLETVCADLESEGYEVQPFIIPAVAVGAPHRRDRVWIIGRNTQYSQHARLDGTKDRESLDKRDDRHAAGQDEPEQPARSDSIRKRDAKNYPDWNRNWQEVAFSSCHDTVDDGLSRLVDGVPQSYSKWRQNSLKAYGNGIVPEVAMNIMQAIKASM